MPIAADYPFMDILWSMLIFMAFILWIWLAITCFMDIWTYLGSTESRWWLSS